jgi:small-conductance mechanosensitive channel
MNATVFLRPKNAIGCGALPKMAAPASPLKYTSAAKLSPLSGKFNLLKQYYFVDEILKDPAPDVLVIQLAESSVNIRVRWWISPPRRIDDLRSR